MITQLTVCTRCKHFLNKEPDSVRSDVWYNHLCKASPLPVDYDPYDGRLKPWDVNDFGMRYFAREPYKYCRDVNDGTCAKFDPDDTVPDE